MGKLAAIEELPRTYPFIGQMQISVTDKMPFTQKSSA